MWKSLAACSIFEFSSRHHRMVLISLIRTSHLTPSHQTENCYLPLPIYLKFDWLTNSVRAGNYSLFFLVKRSCRTNRLKDLIISFKVIKQLFLENEECRLTEHYLRNYSQSIQDHDLFSTVTAPANRLFQLFGDHGSISFWSRSIQVTTKSSW